MSKEIVAEIFKGIDEKLISEEVKAKVIEMINSVVTARSDAKSVDAVAKATQLEEANKKLIADMEALKKDITEKEAFLKEAAADFGKKLADDFKEKEVILYETVKEFQEETTKVLKETAIEYKAMLEQEALGAAEEYKTFVEQAVLEEAAEFKKMRQSADAETLEKFKGDLIDKADEYMKAELKKNIPAKIMEAAAKAAALEPLVEGMVSVIEKHGISVDKTGYETFKAAKQENQKLSEAFNAKVSDNVKLEARVKELEKTVKLTQLTEGMTQAQKSKAVKVLESCSVDELEAKFKVVKDIIIAESVKPKQVSVKDTKSQAVVDAATKQVNRIVESVTKTADSGSEMGMWATNLDRMRRN